VLTSGVLSRSAEFSVLVAGHVGRKELERLIQKLEMDKDILAEDEAAELPVAPALNGQ
jgi:hypothetical protein